MYSLILLGDTYGELSLNNIVMYSLILLGDIYGE